MKEAVSRPLGPAQSISYDLDARGIEQKIAQAQRRGHRRQVQYLHRRAANRRRDALHKFSRQIVNQKIVVGDVSSLKLAKTRAAKSVLDSGSVARGRYLILGTPS
jgi:transposase